MTMTMNEEELVHLHLKLAGYHAERANEAVLNMVHEYHRSLADRLAQEALEIVERREASERETTRKRSD